MCYGSAAPVEQGVSVYLIPGDRSIKAILSPLVSKVCSPHSAISVNTGPCKSSVCDDPTAEKVIHIRKGRRIKH